MKNNLKILLVISVILNLFFGYTLLNKSEEEPIQEPVKRLSDVDFFTEYYKTDDQILFLGDSWISQGKWKESLNHPSITNKKNHLSMIHTI